MQLENSNGGSKNLLTIMAAVRAPDMSMPLAVDGLPLKEALIPTISKDQQQMNALVQYRSVEAEKLLAASLEKKSLSQLLTNFDIEGNQVYDNKEYWAQYSSNTLSGKEDSSKISSAMVTNLEVTHDDSGPNFNVPTTGNSEMKYELFTLIISTYSIMFYSVLASNISESK